jgi:hypothetical protein
MMQPSVVCDARFGEILVPTRYSRVCVPLLHEGPSSRCRPRARRCSSRWLQRCRRSNPRVPQPTIDPFPANQSALSSLVYMTDCHRSGLIANVQRSVRVRTLLGEQE